MMFQADGPDATCRACVWAVVVVVLVLVLVLVVVVLHNMSTYIYCGWTNSTPRIPNQEQQ